MYSSYLTILFLLFFFQFSLFSVLFLFIFLLIQWISTYVSLMAFRAFHSILWSIYTNICKHRDRDHWQSHTYIQSAYQCVRKRGEFEAPNILKDADFDWRNKNSFLCMYLYWVTSIHPTSDLTYSHALHRFSANAHMITFRWREN